MSTETEGISVTPIEPTGRPGTTVRARLADDSRVSAQDARQYLRDFVEFVGIPVLFNGENISGSSHRETLPSERHAWVEHRQDISIPGILQGDLEVIGMASGELRIVLYNIKSAVGIGRPGSIVLLQERNAIRTLRSGFGLATVGAPSRYRWGGVIDLPFFSPTAGREALDASSSQLLQQVLSALDNLVSPIAAQHAESFENDCFLRWIAATNQFELCGPLEVRPRPAGQPRPLESVVNHAGLRYYGGREDSVIQAYASEDEPLVVLSRRAPRRDCEQGYLVARGVQEVDITPRVTEELPLASQSFAHSALATRITRILEEDYFLGAEIRFGSISGAWPCSSTIRGYPLSYTWTPIPPALPRY